MKSSWIIWPLLLPPLFFFSCQQENPPGQTTVFEYTITETDTFGYRIPALVTSREGTLLAFAEKRKGLHDHAQNDIVLRRSFDNGRTWQEEQLIAEDGKNSLNDPCVVVPESGRILLIYQRFPYGYHARNSGWIKMADTGYEGPRTTKSFLVHSDDDGESWSPPREITKMLRHEERVSVGSPGRGIQLSKGEFKGRIIFPLYETIPDGKGDRTWRNRIAYSDDQGETWIRSGMIPHDDTLHFGNEAQVVELADGSLLFNARNQEGHYRKVSRSRDGGITWDPMKLDEGLPGVACMGSIINHHGLLVFAGPAHQERRTNGTVRISEDNGKTWNRSREVIPGSYAYSCLTTLSNDRIGLLFEADKYQRIKFMSFKTAWITENRP